MGRVSVVLVRNDDLDIIANDPEIGAHIVNAILASNRSGRYSIPSSNGRVHATNSMEVILPSVHSSETHVVAIDGGTGFPIYAHKCKESGLPPSSNIESELVRIVKALGYRVTKTR